MEYSIRIGGEAGQGIQTISSVLGRLFARMGYEVFTHQDYMSRVRGGHNFNQVRFSDKPVSASREKIDILIALDRMTVETHKGDLNPGGVIAYDGESIGEKFEGPEYVDIPMRGIAVDQVRNRVTENTVAVGAVLGMLGLDLAPLEELLAETFGRKGQVVVDQNLVAARAGYDYAGGNCPKCGFDLGAPGTPAEAKLLMESTSAVGLGALLGGCRFYCAYPMTPSTGVLNFMAGRSEQYGLMVEQAEDEISAINMAIGASYAGVRAMTGTAGGGFALMGEGLSLAGMTETPVVIYIGQRPAPATGLPTRTEQGDLQLVLHAAHGEFPRIIMAPGHPLQAIKLTHKAFDLAEKYQVPAFIISDTYLADAEWTLPEPDLSAFRNHDYRLRANELLALDSYQRHAYTESGVSPMAVPGESRHLVVTDSDEHDQDGHIIEDAETRVKMVQKRLLLKLPLLREEMEPPLHYGAGPAEIVLIGWGSTYGLLKETVDRLGEKHSIAMMHFSEIWPFPSTDRHAFMAVLQEARRTICIENNATSQFALLLRAETGYQVSDSINKFDGRPFLLDELMREVEARIG